MHQWKVGVLIYLFISLYVVNNLNYDFRFDIAVTLLEKISTH